MHVLRLVSCCLASAAALAAAARAASSAPLPPAPVAHDPGPAPAPLPPCGSGEVCVQGPLEAAVCMGADGEATTDGTPCKPHGGARECSAGQACMVFQRPNGELGYCVRRCRVRDERPACVPGCYNQLCSGAFDLCVRDHGTCRPVPCASDQDCAEVGGCDYPAADGAGFRCNPDARLCERARD